MPTQENGQSQRRNCDKLYTVEPFCHKTKYVVNLLPSVPIVGNPGEVVNILSLEPRSCNAEMMPPCIMTVGGLCSHLECRSPRGPVLCHPVFYYCLWQHWSRRESPWGRSYRTAQWQPQGLRRTAPWLKCLHFLSEHTQQWMTEIRRRA